MGDAIKGFFLLIMLIVGAAVAYATWLVLIPVTESDAEFRLSNVCYGGQLISSTLKGAEHRPVSCDCVNEGLVKTVGSGAMAKGVDAIRQMFVAQAWAMAQGQKPAPPDKSLLADREVLTFIAAMHRLDRDCRISPFSAAARGVNG